MYCPEFTAISYSGSVLENATEYTQVLTVSAYNLNGDNMNYGLTYFGENLPFDIGPSTGVIHVSGHLDYKVQARYDFSVTAFELTYGYNQVVPCTIFVTDVLDPVACSPDPLLVAIKENTPVGNITQCISCSSPDQPNEILQYITSTSLISIDSSGLIWLNETVDYENETNKFNVSVKFTDSNGDKLQGYGSIEILVLPINEFPPSFNQSQYNFTIIEGSNTGSFIGTVNAHDQDDGPDGILHFTIVNDDTQFFHISSESGNIYSSIVFDCEDQSSFSFNVSVIDKPMDAFTALSDTAIINVNVVDVNDNPPVFSENPYISRVPENVLISSVILTVHCTDDDSLASNSDVEYSCSNDTEHFAINITSGEIMLTSQLDFEQDKYHQFSIKCRDPSFESESLVIIEVLETNEHTPYFVTNDSFVVTLVPDDLMAGDFIAKFQASDDDSGLSGELVYTINHTDVCPESIGIISDKGTVFLSKALELENGDHSLLCLVIVRDNHPPYRTAEGHLTIWFESGNNHPPQCDLDFSVVYQPEDAPIGSLISKLNYTDKDDSHLTYLAVPENQFIINVSNDIVSLLLADKLDYEIKESYKIEITVSDSKYSVLCTVLLVVEPVNEHQPTFKNGELYCSVSESSPIGQFVCAIAATDKDHGLDGLISYTLDNQDDFLIDQQSGKIYINELLDYEDIKEYNLSIFAVDGSLSNLQFTATAQVIITVIDSNDNYPIIKLPVHLIVDENINIGSVIAIMNCTDLDSHENGLTNFQISSITSHDHNKVVKNLTQNPFTIDNLSGEMAVNVSLDFELIPYYEVVVACCDNGTPMKLSSTATVSVTVSNINEYIPAFDKEFVFVNVSIDDEPDTQLLTATAKDADYNDKMVYSMSLVEPQTVSRSSTFFQIDPTTGIISLLSAVHCSESFEFLYNTSVTDSGGLTDNMKVLFRITDCRSMPIVLTGEIFTASVQENKPPFISITQIQCSTPDDIKLPSTSKIEYGLLNETIFFIGKENGSFVSLLPLDFEQQSLHIVHAFCHYSHSPTVKKTITGFIQVQPKNEYAPDFRNYQQTIEISESSLPGISIAIVSAIDQDDDLDGQVSYTMITDDSHFMIDAESGNVILVKEIDREESNELAITVQATDNALNISDRKTRETVLRIAVKDVNDNYPVCSQVVYFATLPLTATPNTAIVQVNCSDFDAGENGILKFATQNSETDSDGIIVGVNDTTGEVYLKESIINRAAAYHTISIAVSDNGVVPLTTIVYVSVTLRQESGEFSEENVQMETENEGGKNNATATISGINIEQVCLA